MQATRLIQRALVLVHILLLAAAVASAESPPAIPPGDDFGAGLTLLQTTSLAEVMREPEKFEQPILLRGKIADVCQRKGCWTIVHDGTDHLRVRFKDYGFFLPKDSMGAEAFVEGVVKIEMLSEKMARHYASESRSGEPDSIEGPQREVGFTASGVRIIGRD
jgi:hypothetical protein